MDPNVSQSCRCEARWYDRRRVVLLALLGGLALLLAGTVVAVVRGVFATELATFEAKAQQAELHLAEWERSSAELERALEQLRGSRARLQVLVSAIERAQARTRWLRVFVAR
jgi:hypothetical protein